MNVFLTSQSILPQNDEVHFRYSLNPENDQVIKLNKTVSQVRYICLRKVSLSFTLQMKSIHEGLGENQFLVYFNDDNGVEQTLDMYGVTALYDTPAELGNEIASEMTAAESNGASWAFNWAHGRFAQFTKTGGLQTSGIYVDFRDAPLLAGYLGFKVCKHIGTNGTTIAAPGYSSNQGTIKNLFLTIDPLFTDKTEYNSNMDPKVSWTWAIPLPTISMSSETFINYEPNFDYDLTFENSETVRSMRVTFYIFLNGKWAIFNPSKLEWDVEFLLDSKETRKQKILNNSFL